jgi:aminoglycoside phosphotransferase (APT) family kinase protein
MRPGSGWAETIRHARIDARAILQTLGCGNVTAVVPVRAGSDTAIWRVESAGQLYALRVFPPGREDDCEREIAVMQAALAGGIPVPRVHAAGTWRDRSALLLSWLPGRPMAEELRTRPWRAWRLGVLFGRMQAAIHAVPAPDVLMRRPDAWIAWAGPAEESLQVRLRATEHRADALLHLDYHPLNVMTDGTRVTGVLDWTNARAGDPRADAARTITILRVDVTRGGVSLVLERGVRSLFERGWRHGYAQTAGPLGDLTLFYAWAGAVMGRDLAHKRGPWDLARIHHWTAIWKERAGCT